MIGLDTTALIDLFKNDESLIKLLEKIEDTIYLNQINYLELFLGLDPTNKEHIKEGEFYDNLFSSFPNLDLDFKASKNASNILWGLKKKGDVIEPFDCVIAGIYLANDVRKIITKNAKHFEKIKGVKVLNY